MEIKERQIKNGKVFLLKKLETNQMKASFFTAAWQDEGNTKTSSYSVAPLDIMTLLVFY